MRQVCVVKLKGVVKKFLNIGPHFQVRQCVFSLAVFAGAMLVQVNGFC